MDTPRRKLVEQSKTWRAAQHPEDMQAIVERMLAKPGVDRAFVVEVVLRWIATAGDVHSAELARLVLPSDEDALGEVLSDEVE